jgi:hypothetical protein
VRLRQGAPSFLHGPPREEVLEESHQGTESLVRGTVRMAFVFHIHPSPSCEFTHSTACASWTALTGIIAVCRLPLDGTEGSVGVYTAIRRVSVTKKSSSSLM